MGERSFFFPFIVDGRVVIESREFNGLPFERFWSFTRENMTDEDKHAAAIGDADMCNTYKPYCLAPEDYIVYKDELDLNRQLLEYACFNSAMRAGLHLNSFVECREGSVDCVVFHQDHLRLSDFDHYLNLDKDQVLGFTFESFQDEADLEHQVKEVVGQIANDLEGFAWDLFPSRLGKIDTAKLACSMLRANARAQCRIGLSDQTIHRIMLGAMVEDVMGYPEADDENKTYDLFAEGMLAVSNHLGMNKFFA